MRLCNNHIDYKLRDILMTIAKNNLFSLMIGAIGIVYGDIGTSPLYALKSCFILTGMNVNESNIFGIISLFIWLLILIVNLKYISIIMRCSQQGEGGVLVLASLCNKLKIPSLKKIIFMLGIIAMALFVGDSVITPAISVLSALEGLKLITPFSENHIVLGSILVLSILFFCQSKGSGLLGRYFGYVMVIWFIVIGMLGLVGIINNPKILMALNPYYALLFLASNGITAWIALGGAVLVITGVEALYADMGHFGKDAIKNSWMFFVMPGLMLNYLGQGSLLLSNPAMIENPFFLLAPKILIYPLVILSIMATIIASQAVISGLFSLSWQAIMLHYLPRMKVEHTSINQRGQIYIPAVNYLLFILTIIAVLTFRNSDSLASAYGLSVSSVMIISSILTSLIAYHLWKWSITKLCAIFIPLLFLDITFLISNLVKIFEGAWYTIIIAASITYIILIWVRGNEALKHYKTNGRQNLQKYLEKYLPIYSTRIPGCAIFMSRAFNKVPYALEIQLKHNKFLHEKNIFIIISTEDIPKVDNDARLTSEEILPNIFSIKARFGFHEIPDLNKIIAWAETKKIIAPNEDLSFFLSRSLPIAAKNGILKGFSEILYIFLANNSLPAHEFFKISYPNLVELGIRYKI